MAGQKFITINSGKLTEVVSVQVGGGGNANLIPALDVNGRLDLTMMPTGVTDETASIVASEALAAGDFVNVYSNAGTANIRKADASASGKEAHGYVTSAVASAASGLVYFEGTNPQVTSQTPGVVYLSGTTPGLATATPPTGTGKVVQTVGFAIAATKIQFQSGTPVVLA